MGGLIWLFRFACYRDHGYDWGDRVVDVVAHDKHRSVSSLDVGTSCTVNPSIPDVHPLGMGEVFGMSEVSVLCNHSLLFFLLSDEIAVVGVTYCKVAPISTVVIGLSELSNGGPISLYSQTQLCSNKPVFSRLSHLTTRLNAIS